MQSSVDVHPEISFLKEKQSVETTGIQNESCILGEVVTWESGDVMGGYTEDATRDSRVPPQNDKHQRSNLGSAFREPWVSQGIRSYRNLYVLPSDGQCNHTNLTQYFLKGCCGWKPWQTSLCFTAEAGCKRFLSWSYGNNTMKMQSPLRTQVPWSIPTSVATHLQKKVFNVGFGKTIIYTKNLMMLTGLWAFPRLVAWRCVSVFIALC